MDIEILELCKENIQPLRKGRKANQLGLALKAEGNAELQTRMLKEREEYELGIITYDGPDPLLPRLEYITWLEQTYIKHGRECNLIPLLEDTITVFKDNPKYKQDPRFIDLVVKYVEAQENAVELFQMVYSQGLGTMCASLYRSWAEVLEQGSDFKRADQVYQLGIANRAEPVDMLKQAHAQFQLSVGRRMMMSGGDLSQPAVEEPQERQALGKLKKGVGSIRTAHGSAGVLSVKSSSKSSSKKPISVFQDGENNYEHLISVALQKNKLGSIATSSKNNEENTLKPGTWNKGYNRKEVSKMHLMPPTTPSFKVHVDPDAETDETPKLAAKTPSNVLKTRKAEILASSNAKEVFTSSSSTHKPLQSNLGVYAGGREFSFEELRAAYYKKQEDIKNSKKEALAQLKTPAKYLIPLNMPSTPLMMGSSHDECETPLPSMRNLSISSDTKESREVQEKCHSPQAGSDEACFKTPFKHPAGFVPITPSLQGIDLSEFIETPVEPPQPKNNKVFSIFVDEECSNASSSNNLLPIIEENQEVENRTSPKIIKKGFVRKKQLFSEE
ncbi:uncharacterized protein [Halyomorpha halys]|uniref:uncharacterized protein n=1 Tax=Halyomorpha halys TaxID=286706 RepID=UPI0006D4F4B8|nr:mitotic checkpoint serine/threonine-protein kinase BUB1 beta [Halyomorpha halys]